MAYYNNNNNNAWSGPPAGNQNHWEPPRPTQHPTPSGAKPSPAPGYDAHQARSGTNPAGPVEDGEPFYYQFKNIERVLETWRKSNKASNEPRGPMPPRLQPPVEFTPMQAPFNGPPPPSFFPSVPPPPPPAAGPSPRFGGARSNEPDQAFQAKRRMAAQRERDLRNYHQDQQFNKHLSGAKSDRSMSPNTAMSENDRRELIARQHRALYGEDSSLYNGENPSPRAGHGSQESRGKPGNGNDSSAAHASAEGQRQPRSRAASNTSPSAAANANSNGSNQQQPPRAPNDGSKDSPPRDGDASAGPAVGPIGTRPTSGVQPAGGVPKRSSPPLTSPLYGYAGAGEQQTQQGDSKAAANAGNSGPTNATTTAAGNNNSADDKPGNNTRGAWGNTGAWGGKGGLGAQAKVWG